MDRSATPARSPAADRARSIRFEDRLLAEAVRAAEDLGADVDDATADAAARETAEDFEGRIVARARSLALSTALAVALRHVQVVAAWLILAAVVLALMAGAGAARTALGGERDAPVIVLPVLGGLLGVQVLLLFVWAGQWCVAPGSLGSASLGGFVLRAARLAARLGTKRMEYLAAVGAYAGVSLHSSIARWKTSVISHSLWTAFNIGCVALLLLLLSTRYYTFGWETTILPDRAYAPLIETIGWLPGLFGFEAPTTAQVAESQWTGTGDPPHNARSVWSSLLVGSVVVYGLAPRVVLLLVAFAGLRRAQRRFRLDTSRPGYVRLRHRLLPAGVTTRVVDADLQAARTGRTSPAGPIDERAVAVNGAVPIIGVELDAPATGWPPSVPGVEWIDLGRLDGRRQRAQALDRLRASPTRPTAVVVVCAMTTTPDRGIAAMLEQLIDAAGAPLVLVLTAGHAMRTRGSADQLRSRVHDWRTLAQQTGIAAHNVMELDLDHATQTSLAQLARVLNPDSAAASPKRRIEEAFGLIVEHRQRWSDPPTDQQQLALHVDLARLYSDTADSWMHRLRQAAGQSATVLDDAQAGARRTMSLLPAALRTSPAWAIAGATAGALGCIAVAALITPAALAALPGWTIVGGALTTIIHGARQIGRASTESRVASSQDDQNGSCVEAVAAATMFALLLELQGRPEQAISAVLDRTLIVDSNPPTEAHALAPWLDEVRHRFDLALAEHAEAGG